MLFDRGNQESTDPEISDFFCGALHHLLMSWPDCCSPYLHIVDNTSAWQPHLFRETSRGLLHVSCTRDLLKRESEWKRTKQFWECLVKKSWEVKWECQAGDKHHKLSKKPRVWQEVYSLELQQFWFWQPCLKTLHHVVLQLQRQFLIWNELSQAPILLWRSTGKNEQTSKWMNK